MRQSSLQRVRDVLDTSAGPLTSTELRKATGLSVNTLNVALRELGARKLTEHYPTKWIKGAGQGKLPAIGKADGDQVLVDLLVRDNWPAIWENRGQTIGSTVGALQLTSASDPKELAAQFSQAAASLASLALALQNVQNDPDWYQKLVH
jgi:hypothetical protein